MKINQNEHYSILNNKYYLIRKLGACENSKVWLGKNIKTSKLVAIKTKKEKTELAFGIRESFFQSEINSLTTLSQKCISNLIEYNTGIVKKEFKYFTVDYLVTEYCPNGELYEFVYFLKKGFQDSIAAFLFDKILDVLEACHNLNIAHRNLKAENILFDTEWNLKITNFEHSTYIQPIESISDGFIGSLPYTPPEVLLQVPYDQVKADIFSAGVILFFLVTSKFPFKNATSKDPDYNLIFKNDFSTFWLKYTKNSTILNENFKNVISLILCNNPDLRPSIKEIKQHLFLLNKAKDDKVFSDLERRNVILRTYKEMNLASNILILNEYKDKLKEDSEGAKFCKNPYKIKILCNSLKFVFKSIKQYYKDIATNYRENLSKSIITIDNKNNKEYLEELRFIIEINKSEHARNKWTIEYFLIHGNKKQFSEIYDDFIKILKNTAIRSYIDSPV